MASNGPTRRPLGELSSSSRNILDAPRSLVYSRVGAFYRHHHFSDLLEENAQIQPTARLLFTPPQRSIEKPCKERGPNLTRDQRFAIRTVHETCPELEYEEIARRVKFPCTRRQVILAIEADRPTPRKNRYREPYGLSDEQKAALDAFLQADEAHLRIPWADLRFLVPEVEGCGRQRIRTALQRMGYVRRRRKTVLKYTRHTRNLRKAFCAWVLENWPHDHQWDPNLHANLPIVFSDESIIRNLPCGPTWLTMKMCEDPSTYDVARKQKHRGWMFWGCFIGDQRGPCYVWPQGTRVNANLYIDEIVPLIKTVMEINPDAYFMQDNAPSHRARATREALREARVNLVDWPPYSPDLNPIENIWAAMKRWIDENYYLDDLVDDALQEAINLAWANLDPDFLRATYMSVPERCRECIRKDGGPTDH